MLKALLLGNLKDKLTALALAVLLWFSIDRELTMSITLSVPLEVLPPDGYTVLSQSNPAVEGVPRAGSVEIEISGPRARVQGLTSADLPCRHRVTRREIPTGPFRENLTAADFALRTGVALARVSPAEIELVLDRIDSAIVKVDPNCVVGSPAPGYRIVQPVTVTPNRVTIEGPRGVLERHKGEPIRLQPIAVTSKATDADNPIVEFARVVGSLDGIPIACKEERIEVRIVIEPIPRQATVRDIPISVVVPPDFPHVLKVDPSTLTLVCEGAEAALQMLRPSHVQIMVSPFEARDWKTATPDVPMACPSRAAWGLGAPEGIRIVGGLIDVSVTVLERK